MLWYEYPIPANSEKQRELIKKLRKWIISLETRGIVEGFAFNHYYPNPSNLHIRFDCSNKNQLETLRKELQREVRQFIPNYDVEKSERLWDGGKNSEQVYKAYEFGSRCAFLAWELVERKRLPENFFSNFYKGESEMGTMVEKIPYEFQYHFNHGLIIHLAYQRVQMSC